MTCIIYYQKEVKNRSLSKFSLIQRSHILYISFQKIFNLLVSVTIPNVVKILNFTVKSLTWSKTMISSASTTVDNLCAMKMEVLCLTASLMAPRIICKLGNKKSGRGEKVYILGKCKLKSSYIL